MQVYLYYFFDHKTIADNKPATAVISHTAEVEPNIAIHTVPKIGAITLGKLTLVLKTP
jgi:hypothetical protein